MASSLLRAAKSPSQESNTSGRQFWSQEQRDREERNKALALKMKDLSQSSPLTTDQRHRMYKSKKVTLDKNAARRLPTSSPAAEPMDLPDAARTDSYSSLYPETPMEFPEPELYTDPSDLSQHLTPRESFYKTPSQNDPLQQTPRDPLLATPRLTRDAQSLTSTSRDSQLPTPMDIQGSSPAQRGTKRLNPIDASSKRPRLMPTQALGSALVFDTWLAGLTANARQPNGMMCMTRGLSPVRSS